MLPPFTVFDNQQVNLEKRPLVHQDEFSNIRFINCVSRQSIIISEGGTSLLRPASLFFKNGTVWKTGFSFYTRIIMEHTGIYQWVPGSLPHLFWCISPVSLYTAGCYKQKQVKRCFNAINAFVCQHNYSFCWKVSSSSINPSKRNNKLKSLMIN